MEQTLLPGNRAQNALIIVDAQLDFLTGSLAVPDAPEIIPYIVKYMVWQSPTLVIATRDWHPEHHISFKEWPVHCVQGTDGAKLDPEIDLLANVIISKGMDVNVEEYSGFANPAMTPMLRDSEVITVVGLATGHCVKATALDARKWCPWAEIRVNLKACRGIDPKTTREAIHEMLDAGVEVDA